MSIQFPLAEAQQHVALIKIAPGDMQSARRFAALSVEPQYSVRNAR